ncbi:MAG: glycosyltransferase [Leptolyngbya sp. Prado105]|jgi:hypothetical protein|nr:glycosyltransferase [Leptolyngbya sp. Prado105]
MFKPKELILRPNPTPLADFNLTQSTTRIIACPNPPPEAVQAGHAIAIPGESFHIQTLLKQIPFQPDLVSLSARVMTFLPRGLHQLNCPTVMKLGDTFHPSDGGLSRMVSYCKRLNCDYHWTYQSPQHLHFFAESGLKNVFWLPGSIVIEPHIPKPAEQKYPVIFRGSESELHQYRTHILSLLKSSGIEVDICQKDYISSLEDYAKARIVVNSSLNGDLNRRVFEVLMAGGFLLSDRIAPESGLYKLFEEGTHFECYGDETELLEKIQFYLTHPQQAAKIAAAGHQHFLKYYSQPRMQQQLYRSIFNRIEAPRHDRRPQTTKNLPTRLKVYEFIQELHRIYPKLKILCSEIDPAIQSDLSDLPRAQITTACPPPLNLREGLGAAPDSNTAQILIFDSSTRALKQHIQASLNTLDDRGFLILLRPSIFTILRLNQWLSEHHCIPVQLSVQLFNQKYNLALEQHGFVYQKIIPKAHSAPLQDRENLTITQIDTRKMIRDRLKAISVIRCILYCIRILRSWLR